MAKVYDGRWRYVRNVATGGQGSVSVVTDDTQEFPGDLARKSLINADSQERVKRFQRETVVLKELEHPNILKIHFEQLAPPNGEKPYFISEYCAGGSMESRGASYLDQVSVAATLLTPIAKALEAAHSKHIYHRDCKPSNILFRSDVMPVLGDFGICHKEDGEFVTLSDAGLGSKNFIAPEMESGGSGEVSAATDVYSMAKILFWMVTGGKTIAREDHRAGDPLKISADRQRFEHVHLFLDNFLLSEPVKRKSMSDFRRDLNELAMLVEKDFVPLSPKLAIRCRFCGLGTYQRSQNGSGFSVPEAGLVVTSGYYVVAMWCDHCGHIQSFNLKASGYREWWNGSNKL